MTALPTPTAVRVPKAGELVAAHLRQMIIRGELREGDALPTERALMEQFGVSRPTLREAFRILESEQIIDIRRGARGGARVLVPNSDVVAYYTGLLLQYRQTPLADVYDARASLEITAVEKLAKNRTAADIKRLDAAVAEGAEVVDDVARYSAHDTAFHRLLLELAGNETLGLLVDMLYRVIDRHSEATRPDRTAEEHRTGAQVAQRAHAKLVDLIRGKERDKAVAFWRKHLNQVRTYMVGDPEETVLDLLS